MTAEQATASNGEPELLVRRASAAAEIPQTLLDDLGGVDYADLLGKAMRGEITLRPPPPPRRHRCIACWLVSLLPGHTRCPHGFLECEDCHEP